MLFMFTVFSMWITHHIIFIILLMNMTDYTYEHFKTLKWPKTPKQHNAPAIGVDLCQTVDHGCEHQCVRTTDSYMCRCFVGFILAEDGRSCKRMTSTFSLTPNLLFLSYFLWAVPHVLNPADYKVISTKPVYNKWGLENSIYSISEELLFP